MKATFVDDKDNCARVVFEDTTPYFVNALRRTMIADIPKLAINDVTIYDNTSALFDEIIAHRLGLIPLPTHTDIMTQKEGCSCKGEGCPSCIVHYTLSKEGECTVYSGDLRPEDPMWTVVDKNIPIVKLKKNQRLILEAAAEIGIGRSHAKWQVANGVGYKYYPQIKIDEKECTLCNDCVEQCPRDILEVKRNKLSVKNIEDCILCNTCMEVCGKNAITVTSDENTIIFQLETDGSISARQLLKNALTLLHTKYDQLIKQL